MWTQTTVPPNPTAFKPNHFVLLYKDDPVIEDHYRDLTSPPRQHSTPTKDDKEFPPLPSAGSPVSPAAYTPVRPVPSPRRPTYSSPNADSSLPSINFSSNAGATSCHTPKSSAASASSEQSPVTPPSSSLLGQDHDSLSSDISMVSEGPIHAVGGHDLPGSKKDFLDVDSLVRQLTSDIAPLPLVPRFLKEN